jgi:hypothetical protein
MSSGQFWPRLPSVLIFQGMFIIMFISPSFRDDELHMRRQPTPTISHVASATQLRNSCAYESGHIRVDLATFRLFAALYRCAKLSLNFVTLSFLQVAYVCSLYP